MAIACKWQFFINNSACVTLDFFASQCRFLDMWLVNESTQQQSEWVLLKVALVSAAIWSQVSKLTAKYVYI